MKRKSNDRSWQENMVSGKLPPEKFPPIKLPPGKFPPGKFPPGIFPPMILNIPSFEIMYQKNCSLPGQVR